jgi:transposase-like protein
LPKVKEQIIEMSINGSGVRDIARVLKISPTTVIEELKKRISRATCKPGFGEAAESF